MQKTFYSFLIFIFSLFLHETNTPHVILRIFMCFPFILSQQAKNAFTRKLGWIIFYYDYIGGDITTPAPRVCVSLPRFLIAL